MHDRVLRAAEVGVVAGTPQWVDCDSISKGSVAGLIPVVVLDWTEISYRIPLHLMIDVTNGCEPVHNLSK